jgi:hypothetical protein
MEPSIAMQLVGAGFELFGLYAVATGITEARRRWAPERLGIVGEVRALCGRALTHVGAWLGRKPEPIVHSASASMSGGGH